MLVNSKKLEAIKACREGIDWFVKKYGDKNVDLHSLYVDLINENHEKWMNWFITRSLDKNNLIKYAIYAAEQVIHIYEDKYPTDNRPRKAIEAAKDYLDGKSVNIAAAYADAAYAAAAYADAAYAVYAAAAAAAYAAAYAAYADAAYAAYAAAHASHAAAADKKEMYKKILDYGIKLLTKQGGKMMNTTKPLLTATETQSVEGRENIQFTAGITTIIPPEDVSINIFLKGVGAVGVQNLIKMIEAIKETTNMRFTGRAIKNYCEYLLETLEGKQI